MGPRNELLVGQIALDLGFITQQQLNVCLDFQAGVDHPQPIGSLLVAKGYLTDKQLLDIMDEQQKRLGQKNKYSEVRREDGLFGKLVVRHGIVTVDQVNEALRIQQEMAEKGILKRLGEIMLDSGELTPDSILEILHDQGKTIMMCPACMKRYNVVNFDEKKAPQCRECEADLEVDHDTTVIRVDDTHWGHTRKEGKRE